MAGGTVVVLKTIAGDGLMTRSNCSLAVMGVGVPESVTSKVRLGSTAQDAVSGPVLVIRPAEVMVRHAGSVLPWARLQV